ncbi:hypothetical protein [Janthinobacterium sp.]|uniref:hypothetical protein n=1 Tax=Janthinobacterium sp. TaxID=1871054 RepID=UPI002DBAF6D7|nr:hypothetical protein [Janthinobacterium sp.]HEU4817685.1 hypothetical protein [Janthinobacterium sp.]
MTELNAAPAGARWPVWLAVMAGWLLQLALKALLPLVLQAAGASHWYASQAAIFMGSAIAGGLAARLAPGRPLAVASALVVLSLLSACFEQFPQPMSAMVALVWLGGPCLGLIAGVLLARPWARNAH